MSCFPNIVKTTSNCLSIFNIYNKPFKHWYLTAALIEHCKSFILKFDCSFLGTFLYPMTKSDIMIVEATYTRAASQLRFIKSQVHISTKYVYKRIVFQTGVNLAQCNSRAEKDSIRETNMSPVSFSSHEIRKHKQTKRP